jgi:hypothetical protein
MIIRRYHRRLFYESIRTGKLAPHGRAGNMNPLRQCHRILLAFSSKIVLVNVRNPLFFKLVTTFSHNMVATPLA